MVCVLPSRSGYGLFILYGQVSGFGLRHVSGATLFFFLSKALTEVVLGVLLTGSD